MSAPKPADPSGVVRAYHQRSKHRLERYAAGPHGLDWDTQPDPFRGFAGAPRVELPLRADALDTLYAALYQPGAVAARPLDLDNLGLLFELSLGLAAWKEYGGARWALRCNPSSGNLHPGEGYVLSADGAALPPGVYHYLSREHLLERRCAFSAGTAAACAEQVPPGTALLGLSSIHWREAWKYGERAFRYCQLDSGHALAALRYAAAALGWRLTLLDAWADADSAGALGLDRPEDFADAEGEDAEAVLLLDTRAGAAECPQPDGAALAALLRGKPWAGQANRLTALPRQEWPVIGEVAAASRKPATPPPLWPAPELPPPLPCPPGAGRAAALVRRRRSAQAFDVRTSLPAAGLYRLLDCLLPRPGVPPWDAWPLAPRVHPVLFVHRVAGLPPGLYAFPRHIAAVDALRAAMRPDFGWERPAECPAHLPLYHLLSGDARHAAEVVSCRQAIAADSAFSLGMLGEFDAALAQGAWMYRRLFQEAGMLGQVLYLEAEAAGLRGTGIGCYFDDVFHEMLGLQDTRWQSVYHFTVGGGLRDARLQTLPPYAHLPARRRGAS